MSTGDNIPFEDIEQLPLETFSEKAYLEYSMYVILDRALPFIGDGLKPVQRRIVYAMSELNLKSTAKHKKSARTVGDVLGKFHPHGDSACYEAMVLMAQPFSYRYPLVDGQGNWGSPDDPKSFAAMRYTESRLARYADTLLKELEQGTVEWVPNFDGTIKEPSVLPARLPNVLLNGTTGIAVGMATDIPPHNLREVAGACIHLLENPKAAVEDLVQFVQGPDFPTEAEIITPRSEIIDMYSTGTGTLRMRAVYTKENGDIVITGLPYQVSGAKVLEQIASQMNAKKLPMVEDLRDESDHEAPTRLVIVPRSNRIDKDALMAHLFATTDLERTYRINMNVIGIDGRPQVKGLKAMLQEWLVFRKDTVTKRLQYRLGKVNNRLIILEALMIAYLNLDDVIEIVRYDNNPKAVLMARFKLTDEQAEAILETKLRHLAKLEETKIIEEQEALIKEKKDLEKTLASSFRLKTLIKKELESDAEEYGDNRHSPIVERGEAQALKQEDIVPVEPITIILSEKGWVRSAKGHEIELSNLNYKTGDTFKAAAYGKSNQPAVFFDSTGRCYTLPGHSFPSARSYGEPLSGRLNMPAGASVVSVMMGNDDQLFLISSEAGYGFVCKLSDLYSKNRNGKAVLSLSSQARAQEPKRIIEHKTDIIAAVSNEGRMLMFPVKNLPMLAKGKGNKIIHIPPARVKSGEEFMKEIVIIPKGYDLVVFSGKRHLTLNPKNFTDYMGERGRRGRKLPRGYRIVDRLELKEPKQMALL